MGNRCKDSLQYGNDHHAGHFLRCIDAASACEACFVMFRITGQLTEIKAMKKGKNSVRQSKGIPTTFRINPCCVVWLARQFPPHHEPVVAIRRDVLLGCAILIASKILLGKFRLAGFIRMPPWKSGSSVLQQRYFSSITVEQEFPKAFVQ